MLHMPIPDGPDQNTLYICNHEMISSLQIVSGQVFYTDQTIYKSNNLFYNFTIYKVNYLTSVDVPSRRKKSHSCF